MKFNITASQELQARIQNLETELAEAKKLHTERQRVCGESEDNINMLIDIIKGLQEAKAILVEAGK
jgi:hypothetical protein